MYNKYIKYKTKYLKLKKQIGGSIVSNPNNDWNVEIDLRLKNLDQGKLKKRNK